MIVRSVSERGTVSTMRLGIRTQLIGHTLLTALLVGGSTIGYSIYHHRSSIRQELHTKAVTMAAALADALLVPIELEDLGRPERSSISAGVIGKPCTCP